MRNFFKFHPGSGPNRTPRRGRSRGLGAAPDPVSTSKIEGLIFRLKSQYTIMIVTHDVQQAARVAEKTGFFLNGRMVEIDSTHRIFTNSAGKRTEDYITGRFG